MRWFRRLCRSCCCRFYCEIKAVFGARNHKTEYILNWKMRDRCDCARHNDNVEKDVILAFNGIKNLNCFHSPQIELYRNDPTIVVCLVVSLEFFFFNTISVYCLLRTLFSREITITSKTVFTYEHFSFIHLLWCVCICTICVWPPSNVIDVPIHITFKSRLFNIMILFVFESNLFFSCIQETHTDTHPLTHTHTHILAKW